MLFSITVNVKFLWFLFFIQSHYLIESCNTRILNLFENCTLLTNVCPNNQVQFWLYTRDNQDNPIRLDLDRPITFENAPLKKNVPIKILIHGYTGWKDYSPNTEIRPALLDQMDLNVISVDYGLVAKESCYLHAALNVEVVSNCTAQFIDYLIERFGFQLEQFHVIGFSLGAHVAGSIADFLQNGQLERITGLDPALPFFWEFGLRKLSPNDAKFVDVLHTNALRKGKLLPVGHVDFYANGGMTQPGCENEEYIHSCNHARAPAYYAESIGTINPFFSRECEDWINHLIKKCPFNGNVQIMGENTPHTARGNYFFSTNSEPPYSRGISGILD